MMAGPGDRPLLFLDVDGPLIPFRARPAGDSSAKDAVAGSADLSGNPLLDRINPADGRRLLELGCQLVWATSWMADANELVAPRLGFPELPVVGFPDDDEDSGRGLHWKTRFLAQWADRRRFVWLDDEIADADRRWVQSQYPGKALLHRVDPLVGLTDADFVLVREWLAAP